MANPNLQAGLEYWENQEATVDGVLGGYGTGSLPRVDALSSRLLLLKMLPNLSTIDSPLRRLNTSSERPRFRALDVGAGVGRVTDTVLLQLMDEVIVVEPVEPLIKQAVAGSVNWKGVQSLQKGVIFVKKPLQKFNPVDTIAEEDIFARAGAPVDLSSPSSFHVVWCQWCLGHLSDKQLVKFLKQAKQALTADGLIIVKENICEPAKQGEPESVYDPDDSSLTRSHRTWIRVFEEAGLKVLKQEIQKGFPRELYEVRAYVLS